MTEKGLYWKLGDRFSLRWSLYWARYDPLRATSSFLFHKIIELFWMEKYLRGTTRGKKKKVHMLLNLLTKIFWESLLIIRTSFIVIVLSFSSFSCSCFLLVSPQRLVLSSILSCFSFSISAFRFSSSLSFDCW